MDVILCHQIADFDALGSAVGLSRLHPGSRIVLTGGAHPTVREFLSLHRNELNLIELRSVNPDRLRRIYIVDNQQGDRLGKAAQWLTLPHIEQVILYDHHPSGPGDIPADIKEIAAIGATTTLIVEKLQQTALTLNPVEASIMALGIHVDTGSLLFPQTTVRDAQALVWLMEQGANLSLVAEYAQPGFPPPLQQLFTTALQTLTTETHRGYRLGQVFLESDTFVAGLSNLTENLLVLAECDGLIVGHRYGKGEEGFRFSIIGRTRIPQTDLTPLMVAYGGGGHASAAAANIRHGDPVEILYRVYAGLKAQVPAPLQARDLMSSPVRTIRPDTSIAAAQGVLFRYGHSGLTVVDDQNQLVGIISRRDLDLALHHGFSHAPVKGYMTRNVKTIDPHTPLPDIEALMVAEDVGRLPVVQDGQLVGIVTRTDVLRQLLQNRHRVTGEMSSSGDRRDPPPHSRSAEQLRRGPFPNPYALLPQHLSPALGKLLAHAAATAQAQGWHLYLVGGAVRDVLLAAADPGEMAPTVPPVQDIDLVVDGFHQTAAVGAGVTLAQGLQSHYPQARLSVHGQFQTAALLWHKDPELDSLWVDIATARTEFYPYPAANPEVEASSIRQDLYRRDFTINALALRLTAPHQGELLDFFGGLRDLQARQVRVLHAHSFIEDPTRIFRAVRFAVKLNFTLEAQTEGYIRYAIESGVYERLRLANNPAPALTTRLRAELVIILGACYWKPALQLLADLGALKCLHPDLQLTPPLGRQIDCLSRWLTILDRQGQLDPALLRLSALLAALPSPERANIAAHLQLPRAMVKALAQLETTEHRITQELGGCPTPSQIVRVLSPYPLMSIYLVAARADKALRREIWRYLTQLRFVNPLLNGEDLKHLGYRPGPPFKAILDALLYATLDRQIGTQEEAIAFLQTHFPLGMAEAGLAPQD